MSAREAVAASLARIAERDGHARAFLTVAGEAALAEAARLDAAPAPVGPLHGVPVAVKDLADTAGLRTTYGSALFRDHVPERDDAVVARLRAAGAVVVGKTMTPEFGFGAVCENRLGGPTRNPFDPELTSGGSSGGSAAAVAEGMVPAAHGTDFGGSVRTPASFCGVASLRPTPGRLPAPARALGWDTLATAGFLARAPDDLRLLLEATAGPDPLDPLSRPWPATRAPDRPRIAATEDFGVAPVARAVRAAFRDAVARAAPEAAWEHPDCAGARETFHALRAPLIAHAFGHLRDRPDAGELTETVRWWLSRAEGASAASYLRAEAARTALYRRFARFFERHDLLLAPAAGVLPWPNAAGDPMEVDGERLQTPVDYLAVTYVVSLVGFPVVTLPLGRAEGGLPVGVQLIGRPGEDEALLDMAERMLPAAP